MLNIETKELKTSDKLKRKIEMIGRLTNNELKQIEYKKDLYFHNYL